MFGLDVKRGLLSPEDREIMRQHTFENKTVENLKAGKKYWFKKGDHSAGRYERSQQTLDRLQDQGRWIAREFPFKKSPRKIITCPICGTKKEVTINSKAKFCGRSCSTINNNRGRKEK